MRPLCCHVLVQFNPYGGPAAELAAALVNADAATDLGAVLTAHGLTVDAGGLTQTQTRRLRAWADRLRPAFTSGASDGSTAGGGSAGGTTSDGSPDGPWSDGLTAGGSAAGGTTSGGSSNGPGSDSSTAGGPAGGGCSAGGFTADGPAAGVSGLDGLVEVVNALLADSACRPYVSRHDGRPPHLHYADERADLAERVAAFTAAGVAAVLCGDHRRLGHCDRPGCAVVYVDTSRNGRRRFCSLRCANQWHVARHRDRAGSAAGTHLE